MYTGFTMWVAFMVGWIGGIVLTANDNRVAKVLIVIGVVFLYAIVLFAGKQ